MDPDRRSPCPPHRLPLPSILHEITESKKSELEMTKTKQYLSIGVKIVIKANGKSESSAVKL